MSTFDVFGPVISCCTREQAIEDGVLVDLSAISSVANAQGRIAVTAAVWAIIDKAVKNRRWMNDLEGVVHDILWMARLSGAGHTKIFRVVITGAGRKRLFRLKMVDDGLEKTIMLPEED